ncbi:arsenate reductase/protein-tyrosine-phosphatase family protein [Malacoplasma iowae]|uniref:arsenate reductase/protein-tyrosine-phosphatase family protein n=1 Tax=Malacoplasma iowae TaxID=2116 RepID=UPI002A18B0C5|nr:hypothetical protein [Malacoplasma iowae]WPL36932.1 hypothetical protein QX179_00400 [Malacoplasma iowae]WPL38128.1 hypothetical protein QX182_01205 [Malacoplasma iowae]WPL41422.1 hypothetical protein QX184_02340 [Malacoplasma iowae]
MKITFVCLGNICRSPMAEFICKDLIVNKYKNNNITVDSAGTSGYHDGEYMHQKTANILQKNNINNKPFVSKKITSNLVNESDYVFAMDNSNYQDARLTCEVQRSKKSVHFICFVCKCSLIKR